jgi:hypothetical protein
MTDDPHGGGQVREVVQNEINPSFSQEAIIRRQMLTVSAVLCVALVAATSAMASSYRTSSLLGSHVASRSATGSCSTAIGHHKDVLLSCSSSSGSAIVSYAFSVPKTAGSVTFCPVGLGWAGSVVSHVTRTGTKVKVTVTVKGAHAHFDILSTWIGYYVKTAK